MRGKRVVVDALDTADILGNYVTYAAWRRALEVINDQDVFFDHDSERPGGDGGDRAT